MYYLITTPKDSCKSCNLIEICLSLHQLILRVQFIRYLLPKSSTNNPGCRGPGEIPSLGVEDGVSRPRRSNSWSFRWIQLGWRTPHHAYFLDPGNAERYGRCYVRPAGLEKPARDEDLYTLRKRQDGWVGALCPNRPRQPRFGGYLSRSKNQPLFYHPLVYNLKYYILLR